LDGFKADRRTFYAVTRCLEIVSEAARRLPSSLRDRHPELPWRAIMGVGNVYRHDYDNVAEELVWRTLQHSLGPLLAVVESEIPRLKRPPREARYRVLNHTTRLYGYKISAECVKAHENRERGRALMRSMVSSTLQHRQTLRHDP